LGCASRGQLPEDKAASVHIDAQEGVPGEVDGAFEYLRGHVSTGANLTVGVSAGFARVEDESQAEISNTRCQILLQEHVFRLKVTVSDGRFAALLLVARHLLVQVHQTARHALCYATQLRPGHHVGFQKFAERTALVVGGDQPEFSL
jgi:hypothetical protein